MNSSLSVAANLSNDARKGLAILSLSKAEPIAHLADREGVSRQFLYRQKQKAVEALDEAFAAKDDDVLFLSAGDRSVVEPYVDGTLPARAFCTVLIRSLASICPAFDCART